jgi:hypothetical protein
MVRRRSTVRFRKGARKWINSNASPAYFRAWEPFWLASPLLTPGARDTRTYLRHVMCLDECQPRGRASQDARWEKVSYSVTPSCSGRVKPRRSLLSRSALDEYPTPGVESVACDGNVTTRRCNWASCLPGRCCQGTGLQAHLVAAQDPAWRTRQSPISDERRFHCVMDPS